MKGSRFIGVLATAFFLCTAFALSFTKADIDIHAKGLVATTGSKYNTGDCWNRPYGYHCSMGLGERAHLSFGSGPHSAWHCTALVRRVGDISSFSRFDVTVNSERCVVHKINDHDYVVQAV